jgi:hypothetical protein
MNLAQYSPEQLKDITPLIEGRALLQDLLDMKHVLSRRKLSRYRPYQKQKDFHAAGARHRERLLMAGISSERPTPAEPSAPITSPDAIPNGGKDAGSTPPFGLGQALKDLRQLAMEFSASCSGSQKTKVSGAQASFPVTIFPTLRSDKDSQTPSILFWSSTSPEAIPPLASSPTIRAESDGKAKP